MKKNLFITIIALAVLAMPMLSSCSSDDDNATVMLADPKNPSPLDDAVQALYKSTWYLMGYAEAGEYTQVGIDGGDPLYRVSFSEGRMDGAAPGTGFGSNVNISGNKIHIEKFICEELYSTDPVWTVYMSMVNQITSFDIREDGLLQLSVTEDSYLLFTATRGSKTTFFDEEHLKEMGLEWAE